MYVFEEQLYGRTKMLKSIGLGSYTSDCGQILILIALQTDGFMNSQGKSLINMYSDIQSRRIPGILNLL